MLFYAVVVFVSFLAGLAAMARFSWRDRRAVLVAVNLLGAVAVGVHPRRQPRPRVPLISLAAAIIIAVTLYALWVRAGPARRDR